MMRTLLKKQLQEVNIRFFFNARTNKRRSKSGTIGIIVAFTLLFIFVGVLFFGFAAYLASVFSPLGLSWMIFVVVDVVAIFFGVFGSVFNTAASLYQAKDNDLLMSLPIPTSKILLARMAGVFIMGFLYECIIMIPSFIAYVLFGKPPATGIVFSLIHIILLGIVIMVISCVLGWVVSLISSRLKNKSYVTVIMALLFFAAYYFFSFNSGNITGNILQNPLESAESLKGGAFLVYLIAEGATGDLVSMVCTAICVFILLFIVVFVLSRSFQGIVIKKDSSAKAVFKEESIRQSSVGISLLKKELRRFTQSATYMLNSAFGTVMMPIVGILAIVFSDNIRMFLRTYSIPFDAMPAVAAGAICILVSMNVVTAPSVSLEGSNIWVLQSLPVPVQKVFDAKQTLHWIVTMPPAAVAAILIGIALQIESVGVLLLVIFSFVCTMFFSAFGLFMNLKRPNLNWSSEAVPVKQSLGVLICILLGIAMGVVIGIAGFLLSLFIQGIPFMLVLILLMLFFVRIINRWIKYKGAAVFESL